MKTQFKLLAGLLLGLAATTASAGTLNLTSITNNDPTDLVPYPNTGTIAAANTFQATGGDVTASFFNYNAEFKSQIGLKVNGSYQGGWGLLNTASSFGQTYNFGYVNAGSTLEFILRVWNKNGSFYSDWSSNTAANSDGLNHTYATQYDGGTAVGGTENGKTIGSGTYVSFEDLKYDGDKDFNDHQFVFNGVAVPEPAGLALLGLGLLALGAARRRAAK